MCSPWARRLGDGVERGDVGWEQSYRGWLEGVQQGLVLPGSPHVGVWAGWVGRAELPGSS